MARIARPHPRAPGYKELVGRFGAGEIADRLLAKWLSDEGAMKNWERLGAMVKYSGQARLNHLEEADQFSGETADWGGYVETTLSPSHAARRAA